jgi:hypothetical protein
MFYFYKSLKGNQISGVCESYRALIQSIQTSELNFLSLTHTQPFISSTYEADIS